MRIHRIMLVVAFHLCLFSSAQEKKKWDINTPDAPGKNITFTTDEGTWMNLDVSPDGKEIVFDLLGDIYTIPISGGSAKVLRTGMAYEVQPRYSPDGAKILFTSDAGGGDNIWTMNRNGSGAKQISKETFRLANNATWSPDGQYIIAKKHFTSTRSLGAGEIWIYHISGGEGIQLVPKKNDQQDINEPSASTDGFIYYSEDMYPGGAFQYNKDPNNQIFAIKRFDRKKGKSEDVTGGAGGAARPQISHDGKKLAFVRRVRTKTVLYVRNMETGEEWPVYDKLSKDQQEAWTVFGVYAGFSWMPDDKNVIIWSNGKIIKINTDGVNEDSIIPFTCQVNQRVTDVVRFKQNINPDKFNVNVIRHATTSPDGKILVFNALGYLWKKKLPDGEPERITQMNNYGFEFEPAFSPDGKTIAYVTWSDSLAGAMYKINLATGAKPKKLTNLKGMYRTPAFSPNGKQIVFSREGGNGVMGSSFTVRPGVYTIDEDGKENFVSEKGEFPRYNSLGDRLYYQTGGNQFGSLTKTFGSYKLDGSDDRTIFKGKFASQYRVSPDERWIAFADLHEVYIATFPQIGKEIEIGSETKSFPVKRISKNAGINLHWASNSERVHYTLGDQYFTINLEDRFEFIANKADSLFKLPETGISVGLSAKADKPEGIIALTNARVITMNADEVLENATVIIEGNLIKFVGKSSEASIPTNAKVIDCSGKTIMPGFIDAHAHGNHFRYGLTPQVHWPYYANLAYGVTTMHDPSALSEMVFAQSELVKTGAMKGPRVFSTGTILYGAEGDFKSVVNSLEDAREALKRSKAYGAFSVKSYNQPRREQRQMIIQAARELKMEVVPEGGSFFFHNMNMIVDGHTTIEHNIPVGVLYNDVINLWKNTGTAYTPTNVVSYGGVSGEYYWYQHTNVWEKKRLLQFTPRSVVDTRSRHRVMIPDEEYENGHILISKTNKKLSDAGVKVNMGAHGQLQGLAAHWEIWMMKQGGMTNLEALKTATINAAESLGFDDWIGSLKAGKLADIIVMDKNPLENIYNTENIVYTIINGRMYDAETMNEMGNYKKVREKFYWEKGRNAGTFPWHDVTDGHGD